MPSRLQTFIFRIALCLGLAAADRSLAGPTGVFYTVESSRHELFPGFMQVAVDTLLIDSALAAKAKARLKHPLEEKRAIFECIWTREGTMGYIYRGKERGKLEWMDFAVALDGGGKVMRVLLTRYREGIGGEVGSSRFMEQFRGKDTGSTLQVGRDIDGISGATISSRAIAAGVRKATWLWTVKYGKT